MSFQSLGFLVFLAVTAAVCLTLGRRSPAAGRRALLAASAVFYLSGGGHAPAGLAVLAAGACCTALALRRGGRALGFAAAWHIGVLLAFQYADFFTGGALSIGLAPLGLSFFTFQQLWLLHEAHAGRAGAQTPENLALYALFFPTVASGPILKPQSFFPQLTGEGFLRPDWRDVSAGLYAICCGTAKKVLLADPLGAVVNAGWAEPSALSAPAAWLVMLGYTLQLYFDFSGYCDIAAGAARLLGLRLPVNFDSPYRSRSVGEFWKRWHITLTSFLRECVYFPLGGSRRGAARTYANILLVFLLSGLWHGAGWTFVLWGALHGLAQILERLWGGRRERLPGLLRWALTFAFVNVAWVFFRAPDVSAAAAVLRAAVTGGMALPDASLLAGLFPTERQAVGALFPALTPLAGPILAAAVYGAALAAALLPGNTVRRMDTFRPTALRAAALTALFVWSALSFSGIAPFIYANF